MKKIIFGVLIILTNKSNAQTVYTDPIFEKSITSSTKIVKIETYYDKTLVYLNIINSRPYSENDYYYTREINTLRFYFLGEKNPQSLVLQDVETKKIYKQIRSRESNMPKGTNRQDFALVGQQKKLFVIAFEKLDSTTKKINLLDGGENKWNDRSGKYWHIYGVMLFNEIEKSNFLLAKVDKEKRERDEAVGQQEIYRKQQEENQKKEKERQTLLKSQIENKTFTGYHFYDFGDYKYTGNFIKGVPNGQGKWEKPDGSWYEGQFKDGQENGQGTLRMIDGKRYYGVFKDGVPNGVFQVKEWTLGGLMSNEWYAEYNMGQLISSHKTKDDFDKFLNASSTNTNTYQNSSSNSDTQSANSEIIKEVVIEIKKKNACASGCSESYLFDIYIDGKKKNWPDEACIAKRVNGEWRTDCPGDVSGTTYICDGGDFQNAIKKYFALRYKGTPQKFTITGN